MNMLRIKSFLENLIVLKFVENYKKSYRNFNIIHVFLGITIILVE